MKATSIATLVVLAGSLSAAGKSPSVEQTTQRAFDAAVAVGEDPRPCGQAIETTPALALVRYCRWVSSATHPPCNTANSCAMIVEHIRYMCRDQPDGAVPCGEGISAAQWKNISRLKAL